MLLNSINLYIVLVMMSFHGEKKTNNRPAINIILDAYSVILIVKYLLRDQHESLRIADEDSEGFQRYFNRDQSVLNVIY